MGSVISTLRDVLRELPVVGELVQEVRPNYSGEWKLENTEGEYGKVLRDVGRPTIIWLLSFSGLSRQNHWKWYSDDIFGGDKMMYFTPTSALRTYSGEVVAV